MTRFRVLFKDTRKDPCEYCGHGQTITTYLRRVSNGKLFRKTHWTGCLTYSAREDSLREVEESSNDEIVIYPNPQNKTTTREEVSD